MEKLELILTEKGMSPQEIKNALYIIAECGDTDLVMLYYNIDGADRQIVEDFIKKYHGTNTHRRIFKL